MVHLKLHLQCPMCPFTCPLADGVIPRHLRQVHGSSHTESLLMRFDKVSELEKTQERGEILMYSPHSFYVTLTIKNVFYLYYDRHLSIVRKYLGHARWIGHGQS